MMQGPRPFSLSAIRACSELRKFAASNPNIGPNESISLLKAVNGSLNGLDFQSALWLDSVLPPHMEVSNSPFGIRLVLQCLIEHVSPAWTTAIPHGRDRVTAVLNVDEIQCFREAGLLDRAPVAEVIDWWDKLATGVRGLTLNRLLQQGRIAERLSFEKERSRLEQAEITLMPEWVSLDDNSLGYDILSYDLVDGTISPKQIEVKGAMRDLIYISKNEWRNAMSASRYEFHIWVMPREECFILKASELEPHVPKDRGDGQWESISISISKLLNLNIQPSADNFAQEVL